MDKIFAEDFAVFILTNGRPDKVVTFKSIIDSGYRGKIFIIIDDLDPCRAEYIKRFGDKVVIFDKKEIAKTFDSADNFDDMRAIIYARNACFKIAKDIGLKYFIQLDDDYTNFSFRFDDKLDFKEKTTRNMDGVLKVMLRFYIASGCCSIAMAQGGDFIGGKQSAFADGLKMKRKAMNSFICSTDRPFQFVGRINEDVNTYTAQAAKGLLFFTINQVGLHQKRTQSNSGGMSEMYLESGTYVKSFYSVMLHPSGVKIGMMGNKDKRLHHVVAWNHTAPLIVSEDLRKNRNNEGCYAKINS
jgi:hypothetical protein